MNDVNQLAAMLQADNEPASEELETTGETEEQIDAQEVESEEEYSEELEASEEVETEDEGEEQEPADWHTVKVDGEEMQVTLDEALKGYQRDADYRKKTMTLAEERKTVQADKDRIGSLINSVDSFIKSEQESIDWDALKQDNPEQYIAKREALQEAEQVKQAAIAEQQQNYQETVSRETAALVEAMGGNDVWSQDQRNTDLKLAGEYLKEKGVSDKDIESITDHRLWTIIFDAAKAQKFKTTEAKVREQVRKAPKSVKPGQKIPAGERKVKAASNKLRNARNSQEGVNALTEILKLQR
jgi:preprotein translocase subunit SecD